MYSSNLKAQSKALVTPFLHPWFLSKDLIFTLPELDFLENEEHFNKL